MNLQMLMSLRQALQNRLQHMPPGPTVQPVGRSRAHGMGMAPAAVAQAAMPGQMMPGVSPPVTPGVGMPALRVPQTIGEARTQPRLGSLLSGM